MGVRGRPLTIRGAGRKFSKHEMAIHVYFPIFKAKQKRKKKCTHVVFIIILHVL